MTFIYSWWPHIIASIGAIITFLFKDKVLDIIKWFLERIQPDRIKALDAHEAKDDERFDGMKDQIKDVKAYIGDVKAEVIQAMSQNIGYIREDMKEDRDASEKRVQFLEKVFLDSRLDKN
jgi:tryptophanyl-tRNA synthetase